jgi:DNA-binding transcriptional MerR regulator
VYGQHMISTTDTMTSQQAAHASGLSLDTLRYYERLGLFPEPRVQRDTNGYRRFTNHDLHWIRFVLQLRDTGMTLEQIQVFVKLARDGENTIAQRQALLEAHVLEIDQRIAQMRDMREVVQEKITHYRSLLQPDEPSQKTLVELAQRVSHKSQRT